MGIVPGLLVVLIVGWPHQGVLGYHWTEHDIRLCLKSNLSVMSTRENCMVENHCICYNTTDSLDKIIGFTNISLLISVSFALILIFAPLIVLFNVNLASGPKQSLVFFYQCLPLATPYGKFTTLLTLQNDLYNSQYFCHTSLYHPLVAPYYILEYIKYLVVIFIIVLVIFLVRCTSCPFHNCLLPWARVRRAVRNFMPKRTVLKGICSLVILAYGNLVSVSSIILKEGALSCCYQVADPNSKRCWEVGSFWTAYRWYMGAACVTLLLLLSLPLSLIYYPTIPALFHKLTKRSLPRFPKLDPVFDVFQGVYKDKMRWYAGLFLLYRVFLWFAHFFAALFRNYSPHTLSLLLAFTTILAIHSVSHPYKKPKHNYLESLVLVDLVLVAICYNCYKQLPNESSLRKVLFALQVFFILLPLLVALVYYGVMFYRRRTCFKKNTFSHLDEMKEDEDKEMDHRGFYLVERMNNVQPESFL